MTTQPAAATGRSIADAWRPRYHITAERNWLNDPNGPIQYDGVYHVFYQANPLQPTWGRMVWGHVSSTDLVTWTRHPVALTPDDGGPDADGCWSGCATVINRRPALYYTGIVKDGPGRVESVCRAWSSDDLTTWTKDPANPLIPGPPPEHDGGFHRDPFLWQGTDGWHLLLGDGTVDGDRQGRVLRYDSKDATTWTYGGVFFDGVRRQQGLDLGMHWECPALLLDGDTAVLIVSCQTPGPDRPLLHSVWFTGSIRAGSFHGELGGRIDQGDTLYAATAFRDASGRHLLWGWAQERIPAGLPGPLPHVGALSLPREVVIDGGVPRFRAVPELDRLRVGRLQPLFLGDQGRGPVVAATTQMELSMVVTGHSGMAGWTLTEGDGADGGPVTTMRLDVDRNQAEVTVVDALGQPRSSVATLPARDRHAARAFVDGSLVELFVDDECVLTTRAYPSQGGWGAASFDVAGVAGEVETGAWALADDSVT
jgi:beta-fructofuranosidase